LAQKIIDFITGLLFVLAPILIAAGGLMILFGGAKPDMISTGKKIITNAIIGIIIALLAWTVINMIFNNLVGSTTDSTGQKVGKTLSGPWNEINCTGGGINEDVASSSEQGQYCMCETPMYDFNPDDYPSETKIIATNLKVKSLESTEKCIEQCVVANSDTYCPVALKKDNIKMYCTTESGVKNISACNVELRTPNLDCRKISEKIYTSESECMDVVTPGTATYDSVFGSRCWANGTFICKCSKVSSGYQLDASAYFKIGGESPWTCEIKNNYYCRLNCKYQECKGSTTLGSCTGVTCSDSNLDICGTIYANCSPTKVGDWVDQINAASKNRTICSLITTTRMVKAIMSQESGGKINSISNAGAGGLMQLLPATANQYKSSCGVTDNITLDWLTNEDNAEKQICIAIEYMKSLVGSCGCSVANIAAGYNGGGGATGACNQSTNCGPAAASDGGECLACSNQEFTRRWQCLWDDNKHTQCNVDNAGGSFNETRKYAPKVSRCYDEFTY
jgi:hypothetical protein